MKQRLLYWVVGLALLFAAAGCDEDTKGKTRITVYPVIELLGSPSVVLYLGENYVDEGYIATLGEEDVTNQVVVKSQVNNSKIGIYGIQYSASNEDGFSASASREVYVVGESSIENLYFGESETAKRHFYDAPIYITDNGDGTYEIDDLIGGFQFNGVNPGLEPGYDFHAEATIKIEVDNTVTQVGKTGSWYFGDKGTVVKLVSGTFDPDTRTFVLNVDYGGDSLKVTLTAITK